jgi:hypothetical protein
MQKPTHTTLLATTLFLLVFGFGCKNKKGNTKTEQLREFSLGTKAKVKKSQFDYDYASLKVKSNFKSATQNTSFIMNIKMEKDSFIWVSVSAFGLEVGRGYITPDSFKMFNRMNKTYCVQSIDYLSNFTKQNFTLRQLQDLFVGNALYDVEQYEKSNNEVLNDYYTHKQEGVEHRFTVNDLFRPMWGMLKDDVAKQSLQVTYSNFSKVKRKGYLPTDLDIEAKANSQKIEITLNYASVNIEPIAPITFNIPKKYKAGC